MESGAWMFFARVLSPVKEELIRQADPYFTIV
jgi:hypothetical protein